MLLTRALLLFALALPLSWPLDTASASWLIHQGRFHVSAHGQFSCRDCHQNIEESGIHPDPALVNRKRSDFFRVEQCLACHDDTLEKLQAGTHGTRQISDAEKYKHCVRCHRPHEELRREDVSRGRYDRSRPPEAQCGACHEPRSETPKLSPHDENCMACHREVDPRSQDGKERIDRLCFHCHGIRGTQAQKVTGEKVGLIDVIGYQSAPHAEIACLTCHPRAAGFNHGNQRSGDCTQCHGRHDEKVAHDAHLLVSCEACHLGNVAPVRDTLSKRILWERIYHPEEPSGVHSMIRGDGEESCGRCHAQGNAVGAAAMILPPKSVLCMPCHAATFSAGDATTIIALILFVAGWSLMLPYWFSGSLPGRDGAGAIGKAWGMLLGLLRAFFSARIGGIAKALVLDILLQRRLYRQSEGRWIIHSLIFWPFVVRFSWGLIALVGSLWAPKWSGAWAMVDKNHPTTALFFDVTGMMVLTGVLLAFARGLLQDMKRAPGLPGQERLALGLIASLVAVGFVLEGMRIAMTGAPQGAEYALIGYWLSGFFTDAAGLTGLYGYVWYLHAALTGAFVAYISFGRLGHVIVGPIVLAMRGAERHLDAHP